MSISRVGHLLVSLACVGMVISPAMARGPAATAKVVSKVFDVALTRDGQLVGQVVNAAGQAEVDLPVFLTQDRKPVTVVKTNGQGNFSAGLPRAGVYVVSVGDRAFTIRAWKPALAPPNSKTGLLCVVDDAIRAQCATGVCDPCAPANCAGGGKRGVMGFLSNPVVLGLGIATAIALPIALNDDDDDDNNGGGTAGNGNGGAGEPAS